MVTALLFTAGKFLIGLYLGKSGVTSAFGAGGSTGGAADSGFTTPRRAFCWARITRVYAHHSGSRVSAPQEQPASSMPQSTVGFVTRESASTTSAFYPATGQKLPPRRKFAAPFGPGRYLRRRAPDAKPWNGGLLGLVVGTILRRFVPAARLLHRPPSNLARLVARLRNVLSGGLFRGVSGSEGAAGRVALTIGEQGVTLLGASRPRRKNLARRERAEGAREPAHDDQEGAYEAFEARAESLYDRDGGLQSVLAGQGKGRVVEVAFTLNGTAISC